MGWVDYVEPCKLSLRTRFSESKGELQGSEWRSDRDCINS